MFLRMMNKLAGIREDPYPGLDPNPIFPQCSEQDQVPKGPNLPPLVLGYTEEIMTIDSSEQAKQSRESFSVASEQENV
jgi:hypothetical protein